MDESAVWSTQDHLMARVSDALELSNYLFLKAHSDSAEDLSPPDPLPRPGTPDPGLAESAEDFASGAELSQFLQEITNF
ncbi:hypothetical protein GO002_30550 [Streptomyces eurocidicus]|nr:hypothetical protein [Streptomyces eurocidicus]